MNSTIRIWEPSGYPLWQWLICGLITIAIIAYMIRWFNASRNSRNLRRPQYTARRLLDLTHRDWHGHWNAGARVAVLDVDLTITGMHQDDISEEMRDYIWELKRQGFKIILASKSKTSRKNIRKQLHGDESWLQIRTNVVKEDPSFLKSIKSMIADVGWTLGPDYKFVLVGDKLTDMGYSDGYESRVITILTNPQFGKDLLGEYLVLRRHFENITLPKMGVQRAPRHERALYLVSKT